MIAFMVDAPTDNPNHFMCTALGSAHECDSSAPEHHVVKGKLPVRHTTCEAAG